MEDLNLSSVLEALLESSTDAIYVRNHSGKILIANQATSQAFGLPLDQIIGNSEESLFLSQSPEKTEITLGSQEFSVKKILLTDPTGKPAQVVTILKPARGASAAQKDFASIVSHDLKNPLSAILLNSAFIKRELAREKELSEKDSALKKQVESMEKSAHRMSQLISNFLDLAKIQTGTFVVNKQSYRLRTLIRDALETFSPLVAARSIELESKISAELPENGLFDREKILQSLLNLVTDAIQNSSAGDKITFALQAEKSNLIFTVSDSGSIQDAEKLSRIFESRPNSGPGLLIAKGIVELHGGKIWFEQAEGQGVKRVFTIPHPEN